MDGVVQDYDGVLFAPGNVPSHCYVIVKVLLFLGLFLSPCNLCYHNAL